jgi:hypothetical protein
MSQVHQTYNNLQFGAQFVQHDIVYSDVGAFGSNSGIQPLTAQVLSREAHRGRWLHPGRPRIRLHPDPPRRPLRLGPRRRQGLGRSVQPDGRHDGPRSV